MIASSRKRQLAAFGLVAAIAGAGFVAGYAYAAQPHMQAAMGYLQNAKSELQLAEANKGGHRVSAIRLVNEAIGEVQAGMAAGM